MKNTLKGFKCLQNDFKPYLLSYHMLPSKSYLLNVYKINKKLTLDSKCFLNIYKIAQERKIMLEKFSNIHHEMCDKQYA